MNLRCGRGIIPNRSKRIPTAPETASRNLPRLALAIPLLAPRIRSNRFAPYFFSKNRCSHKWCQEYHLFRIGNLDKL
jgi:hypothetical protein